MSEEVKKQETKISDETLGGFSKVMDLIAKHGIGNMIIGTLSQIDLLVDQGFYSNRSDLINQAVRE